MKATGLHLPCGSVTTLTLRTASQVSARLQWMVFFPLALLILSASPGLRALQFQVFGSSGHYWELMTNIYNPKGSSGLLRVASFSGDYFMEGENVSGNYFYRKANYYVAVYGSDVSIDETYHPAIRDYALEPMADCLTEAETSSSGFPIASWGIADIQVQHRVIARPFPPELEDHLESLREIPVKLHLKLHVSVQGIPEKSNESTASAYCAVEPGRVGTIFWAELEVKSSSGPQSDETEQILNLVVNRYRTNELIHTYQVIASTEVHARAGKGQDGINYAASAQAIADPLLEVDPDWEYAPYFVVVQESIRNPGQWIELTRDWTNTVVQPALTLTRTNSTVALSWPALAGHFALQVATNLTPPILWAPDTNTLLLTTNAPGPNAYWQVLPAERQHQQRFYQLLSR